MFSRYAGVFCLPPICMQEALWESKRTWSPERNASVEHAIHYETAQQLITTRTLEEMPLHSALVLRLQRAFSLVARMLSVPGSMQKSPVLALARGLGRLQALPALAMALPCLLLSRGHRPPANGVI